MDKKSKMRYKKSRQQHSYKKSKSDSDSSSDSDSGSSYSSSDSGAERKERRKREKREHCQKKLEAKRNHLKRKLKEAKLKKRAAAAAAALSGHSHRALSPATQAKLKKKLAERKHLREREREKHAAVREREHHRVSRSPTKITKIRIHQDVGGSSGSKRVAPQKSPPPRLHHQLMSSREKIIIQTRTRDRTPSAERLRAAVAVDKLTALRHDELLRERERRERDRERAEREAARDKERAEALARCQERQRERERIAREKLRRDEEEKKYGGGSFGGGAERPVGPDRLLPRPADREIAIATARGYNSRERSLEAVGDRGPPRHGGGGHVSKRDAALDAYEREREYLEAERRGLLHHHDPRDELRREREYLAAAAHRRRELSPAAAAAEHYAARMRGGDPRDLYEEEERERAYSRAYLEDARGHPRDPAGWLDPRDLRDREMHELRGGDPRDMRDLREHELYPEERERLVRERDRTLAGRGDWKNDWAEDRHRGGGGSDRGGGGGGNGGDWDEAVSAAPPPTDRAPRGGFVGGPKRGGGVIGGGINVGGPPPQPTVSVKVPLAREKRAPSEPDWDADEEKDGGGQKDDKPSFSGSADASPTPVREKWVAQHDQRDLPPQQREKPLGGGLSSRLEHNERRWPTRETSSAGGGSADWRDSDEAPASSSSRSGAGPLPLHHHRSERGGRGGSFRRGGLDSHGDRFRSHPPSLLTLPVAPPGGPLYGGGSPRFPNKRNMTYTNPNLIKKQQAALAAAKAAAQASAVAAATTAVAAAKAAAQSTANATTSAGILGRPPQTYAANDAPEAGEIVSPEKLPLDATKPSATVADLEEKVSGELSEISDSDDDILNKTEKKQTKADTPDNDDVPAATLKVVTAAVGGGGGILRSSGQNTPTTDFPKADNDEMLDFEEISDGELEEDARNKGVGDALGVDWASLIAETKRQAAETATPNVSDQPTTAKQKWQPHRILLDIGVSMRMAGEEYAKRLLIESLQKLEAEKQQAHCGIIKAEIKEEVASNADDEDSQTTIAAAATAAVMENKNVDKKAPLEELKDPAANVDGMHPIACIQVAQRLRQMERQKLIANACGANSRALSARQDLKLRRQLCGLPARACDFPRPIPAVSEKLKAMALAAFQRTMEVK